METIINIIMWLSIIYFIIYVIVFIMTFFDGLLLVSVLTRDTLKIFNLLGINKGESYRIKRDDINKILDLLYDYDLVCINKIGPKTAREFHSILIRYKNNYIGLSPIDFAYNIYIKQGIEYHGINYSHRKVKDMIIIKNLFGY